MPCADREVGQGVRTATKNHKAIGFINNVCPEKSQAIGFINNMLRRKSLVSTDTVCNYFVGQS